MSSPHSIDVPTLEDKTFIGLVVVVTLAFGWILWPFSGAILWGTVLAIVFAPLYRRLLRAMRQRRVPAALATLAIIVFMVILPLTLIAVALIQEGASTYEKMQSGQLNVGQYLQQIADVLPAWATRLLDRFGLTDFVGLREKLSAGLTQNVQFLASHALNIGQNTAKLIISLGIMLYLLFFLLRDGEALSQRITDAMPLRADQQRDLSRRFTMVIRATVKGNLVVALVQGTLGGLIFALLGIHAPVLGGAVMAFLSLLPGVGAAVVWLPVAIYLLVTGEVWRGIVLFAFGALVISTIDNILRPILVGKDTKLPDYLVLISTLGGIAVFGLNGFIIGPVIAAMFVASWGIFSKEKAPNERALLSDQ